MSGKAGAAHVYDDLQVEERQNKVAEKKSYKRWLVPAAIVLFAVVCFGAGFAIAYFAVPCAGRYIFL